jgi:hypothetical protein
MSKINFIRACLISISYLGFLGIFMNGMKGLVNAFAIAIPNSALAMVITEKFGDIYCAFSDRYRDAGIIVIPVFCAGLVAGRILSVIVDGILSPILILYIFMELSLVPVCIWLMRRDN